MTDEAKRPMANLGLALSEWCRHESGRQFLINADPCYDREIAEMLLGMRPW